MLVGNAWLPQRPCLDFETRSRRTDGQLAFLSPRFNPRTIYLQLGMGDGTLALRAASYVERVYVLDRAELLARTLAWPCNVRLVAYPGDVLPDDTVELAFAAGAPEPEAVHAAYRSLAPGARLFCMPLGHGESARAVLLEAGFTTRSYALIAATAVRCPHSLANLVAGIKRR
jgi:hypothetical protein